jgi:hypothetical protein
MGYNIGSRIRFIASDGLEYAATVIDYQYNNGGSYLVRADGCSEQWISELSITGSA